MGSVFALIFHLQLLENGAHERRGLRNWMSDRYVLGLFVPDISPESNSVQTLLSPSSKTVNRGPPAWYMHAKRSQFTLINLQSMSVW